MLPALPGTRPSTRPSPRQAVLIVLALLLAAASALVAPAPARAATGQPPTVPALKEWNPDSGTYTFTSSSRVVVGLVGGVLDPQLSQTADTFAADLRALTGYPVPVVLGLLPGTGDIVLRNGLLQPSEGYDLSFAGSASIVGQAGDGVFWGTRSVLQMLKQSLTVPRGTASDRPDYPDRAVSVDLTAQSFSVPSLRRLIKDMSYLKYNQLQLRLRPHSTDHPENNAATATPRYSPAQIAELVDLGATYHVDVTGELSTPTHMTDYLAAHPDLQVQDDEGEAEPDIIDMADPDALPYVEELVDEALGHFPGTRWDGGGDRYSDLYNDAEEYELYPSLVDWVHDQTGNPTAPAADAWVLWQNQLDDYLNSQGRTLTVRNDQWFTGMPTALHSDIDIAYWSAFPDTMTPAQIVAAGHDIINQSDRLFLVENTDYSSPEGPTSTWIYETFTPNLFSGDQTIPADNPHLLGAELSIWPNSQDRNELFYEDYAFNPLRALSQKVWGGDRLVAAYADFLPIVDAIGHAPGYATPGPLADGTVYTLGNTSTSTYLTASDPTASNGTVSAGSNSGTSGARWLLTQDTGSGLYRLVSAEDGRCLAAEDGSYAEGAHLVTKDCDTAKPYTSLQWWTLEAGASGYTVRSAASNHVLTTASGTVTQNHGSGAAGQLWQIAPASATTQVTVALTESASVVPAGGSTVVTATVTNHGTSDVTDMNLDLVLPPGSTATPIGSTDLGTLAAGSSEFVGWDVESAIDVDTDDDQLYALATYNTSDTAGASGDFMSTAAGLGGLTAYAANFTSGTVTPVDLATGAAGSAIPVGTHPGTVTSSADAVYVANQGSDSVTVIDPDDNTVTGTLAVGDVPAGLALSPDGSTLWVSEYGEDAIQPVDLATGTPGAKITVSDRPENLVVSPDGTTIWVACKDADRVDVVDIATSTVTHSIEVEGGPQGIVITPDGGKVYVSAANSDDITPIDTATHTTGTEINLGEGPFNMAISPDGSRLAVPLNRESEIWFVDTATDDIDDFVLTGYGMTGVTFSPDGTVAYATNGTDNTVVPVILSDMETGPATPTDHYPISITIPH